MLVLTRCESVKPYLERFFSSMIGLRLNDPGQTQGRKKFELAWGAKIPGGLSLLSVMESFSGNRFKRN